MNAGVAVDLVRELVRLCLIVGGPVLAVVVIVGLASSILQTATQLHELTLSFVPKLLITALALAVSMPWLMGRLVEFANYVLTGVPERL